MKVVWSQKLGAGSRGLSLAREKGWLLAWDQANWLHLFNHAGERQGQVKPPGTLKAAASADDGSAHVAVGSQGELCWLAPDLAIRWQRTLPHSNMAVAVDPFGQYVAVADRRGNVHFLSKFGESVGRFRSPRPLHHLAFVPAAPVLVGTADYGLVTCFDMSGTCRWRDGLVAHAGALAVSGDGADILVACFSEGIQRYDLTGKNNGRRPVAESCRLVSVAFDGTWTLAAGLSTQLMLLDHAGALQAEHALEQPIIDIALSALGDRCHAALVDGAVVCLSVS
jgi:hypothetical protein